MITVHRLYSKYSGNVPNGRFCFIRQWLDVWGSFIELIKKYFSDRLSNWFSKLRVENSRLKTIKNYLKSAFENRATLFKYRGPIFNFIKSFKFKDIWTLIRDIWNNVQLSANILFVSHITKALWLYLSNIEFFKPIIKSLKALIPKYLADNYLLFTSLTGPYLNLEIDGLRTKRLFNFYVYDLLFCLN